MRGERDWYDEVNDLLSLVNAFDSLPGSSLGLCTRSRCFADWTPIESELFVAMATWRSRM